MKERQEQTTFFFNYTTLVFLFIAICCSGSVLAQRGSSVDDLHDLPGIQMPPGEAFNYYSQSALFFTDDPDLVLWGDRKGMRLYNLSKKEVVSEKFKGMRVTALEVNPYRNTEALAGTYDGKFWKVIYNEEKLELEVEEIDFWGTSPIDIIRRFIYHPTDENRIVACTYTTVYFSMDGGITWDMVNPLVIPWEFYSPIVIVVQDPDSIDTLLISGTQSQRFRCGWTDRKLVSVPQVAVPHGYKVFAKGESYVLIGDNAKILSLNFLSFRSFDVEVHPEDSKKFYMAGMGKSIICVERTKERYTLRFMNARLNITYSVDVCNNAPDSIVVTAPSGLFLSTDGGENWEKAS